MTDGELRQRAPERHPGNGNGRPRTGPQPSRQVDEGELTGRHDFHLLVADAAIPECYEVFQTWVTLCGRKLRARELPGSMCPPACQREITYCAECLRVAMERNDAAGVLPEMLGARLG